MPKTQGDTIGLTIKKKIEENEPPIGPLRQVNKNADRKLKLS